MHARQEYLALPLVQANRVRKDGQSFFELTASAFVYATPQQAWGVLTDYDRLAEFVPDLWASRLVARNGREAIIEQYSEAGFLFVSQSIRMRLRILENPFSTIDVALMEGDMRHYAGRWNLAPASGQDAHGTHVTFHGEIEPDFFVPTLIGRSVVQSSVKNMLEAVVAEIERCSRH